MDLKIEFIVKFNLLNVINFVCGCGFWFFIRVKCYYFYFKMKYFCFVVKENGGGIFCFVENERFRFNEEVYEVVDWFVISDEQCDDCYLDYKIKKYVYLVIFCSLCGVCEEL